MRQRSGWMCIVAILAACGSEVPPGPSAIDPVPAVQGFWVGTLTTTATLTEGATPVPGATSRTVTVSLRGQNALIAGLFTGCTVEAWRDDCGPDIPTGSGCLELAPTMGCGATLGDGRAVTLQIPWGYGIGYLTPQHHLVLRSHMALIGGGGHLAFEFNASR